MRENGFMSNKKFDGNSNSLAENGGSNSKKKEVTVDKISYKMKQTRSNIFETEGNGFQTDSVNKSQEKKNGQRAEKQFILRDSLLTELYKVDHFRSIFNIAMTMLIFMYISHSLHEYLETGSFLLGRKTLKISFGGVSNFIKIYSLMIFLTFGTHLGFSIWAYIRIKFYPKSISVKILDYAFLLMHICHQLAFLVYPTKLLLQDELRSGWSIAVLLEQARLLMKMQAFVRSSAPRILAQKPKEDDKISNCPGFSKFLYFLYAPTLIYRNEYPRNKEIRWNIVLWNLLGTIMAVMYGAFIYEKFIVPPFEEIRPTISKPGSIISSIISLLLPTTIFYLLGFYVILHSTQNLLAELLRFGDRLFYMDWWNCTTYTAFYRCWNVLVHDWLHTYIFKDIYEISHNRILSTLTTFLVSAMFHEYAIVFTFRFFYPVLFILFAGFGMTLKITVRNDPKAKNSFLFLFSLNFGNAILFTSYMMEFYARSNCPPYNDELFDLLLPRSWICHDIFSNATAISS